MIQRLLVLKRKEGDGEIVSLVMVMKHLSSAADVLAIKQLDVGSPLYFIVSPNTELGLLCILLCRFLTFITR